MSQETKQFIAFNEFELDTAHRKLLREGKPVPLYAKTFDLLKFLVKNNGRVLTKDEILDKVWEGQFVEESNLSVQVSALRKALGETTSEPRFLVTVPGKGYKFIADVNNGNTEIVIEKHKISRIVVEEEFDDQNNFIENTPNSASLEEKNVTKLANAEQISSRSIATSKIALLFALIAGILIVAGFSGYWLYQENSQVTENQSTSNQIKMIRLTEGKIRSCPSISPDGKFVAYVENSSDGSGSLYLHQTDTNTTLQLLEPGNRTFGCTNFSPDGSLIYYIVNDKKYPDGTLYSIPVLGGIPRRVLNDLGTCFTLSPDGKQVAFYREEKEKNRKNLIIADLEQSGEKTLLTRSFDELIFGMGLTWSPDGKMIAFTAIPEPKQSDLQLTIFGVDLKGGQINPLTTEQFVDMGKMSWTSDGLSLGFVGKKHRQHNELYLMDYPSGNLRRITSGLERYGNYGMNFTTDSSTLVANVFDPNSELWQVDASGDAVQAKRVTSGTNNGTYGISGLADGRISYIFRAGKSLEIKTIKDDGTEEKTLTSDAFNQMDVASSPDGRYLVFTSDQAGGRQIFRMNAEDGFDITQLTFGETSNSKPNVSRDGNWIIYSASIGTRDTVWRIPLVGGKPEQLTDYDCFSPVFAPDGKSFACVYPGDGLVKLASIAIVPAEGGNPIKKFPVVPFRWDHNIQWSPDGREIIFTKSTNGVYNLWQQPVSGDDPQQLTNFSTGFIWNFAYSGDGKSILISRGETFVDLVLIKNFR